MILQKNSRDQGNLYGSEMTFEKIQIPSGRTDWAAKLVLLKRMAGGLRPSDGKNYAHFNDIFNGFSDISNKLGCHKYFSVYTSGEAITRDKFLCISNNYFVTSYLYSAINIICSYFNRVISHYIQF